MKREKFLWPLTQSHHRALVTARKVQEKLTETGPHGEKDRVEEMAIEIKAFYEEELRSHFWDEEKMLALYEGHMGREEPEPERIRKEHRLLEFLMTQATRPSLLSFAETLVRHVRFEEDILFGRVERALDEAEKKTLGNLLGRSSQNSGAGSCVSPI